MLGWKTDLQLLPPANPATSSMYGVTGSVSLAGQFCGVVYANFSQTLAEKIAEQILGDTPPLDAASVHDVVGELTNMITGNIRSRISDAGISCGISMPTVITGSPIVVDPGPAPINIGTACTFNTTSEKATIHLFARFEE